MWSFDKFSKMYKLYVDMRTSAYNTEDVSYNTVESWVSGKDSGKSCLLEQYSMYCDFVCHHLVLL
jgi:hypothetical protein